MLPYRADKEADYRQRFEVLERARVLKRPSGGTGLVIDDEPRLRDLSFVFFVAWLYSSIWNRVKTNKLTAAWVLLPNQDRTVLSLALDQFPLVVPGKSTEKQFLDDSFYACDVDRAEQVDRHGQILLRIDHIRGSRLRTPRQTAAAVQTSSKPRPRTIQPGSPLFLM